MCQLLSTFERSGWSNGNATALRCSSVRLLYSVATRVSGCSFFAASKPGAVPIAAAAAVPPIAVLMKSRRVIGPLHPHSEKLGIILVDIVSHCYHHRLTLTSK